MIEFNSEDINQLNHYLSKRRKIFFIFIGIMLVFWFISPYYKPRTGNALIVDTNYFLALLYFFPWLFFPSFIIWFITIRNFKVEIKKGLKERIQGKVLFNRNGKLCVILDNGSSINLRGDNELLHTVKNNNFIWATYLPRSKFVIRIKIIN